MARGDDDAARSYFVSSFWLLCGLGAVVLALTFGIASAGAAMANTPADAALIFWLIVILGGALAILFPGRACIGLLVAHLRYDLVSSVTIASVLTRLPIVIFVLREGGGLIGLAMAIAGLQMLEACLLGWFAFRVHPGLRLWRRDFAWRRAWELVRYGSHSLLAQVSDLLRFKLSPVIIAGFSTAARVSHFDIADKLNRIVSELTRALMSVVEPVFSRQEGRGDEAAMRRSYLFTCRLAAYASVLLGGMMLIFGGAFLKRWMGATFAATGEASLLHELQQVMLILIIGTVASGAQMPTVGFLFGTSRHKYYARCNVVHGVAVLGLTMLLIRPYGLIGVALGSAIPTALIKFFVQPIWACRALSISLREFIFARALKNLLIPVPFLALVWLASRPLLQPEYFRIALLAGTAGVLFVPYILLLGFAGWERRMILEAILPGRQPPDPPPMAGPEHAARRVPTSEQEPAVAATHQD
jgi:O-antigen/teichoic acid export membrane protein